MLDSGFRSGGASPWHKQDKYLKNKNKVNKIIASQRKIQLRTRIDTGINHQLKDTTKYKPAHPKLRN